jgi:hypothetical protein
MFREEIMRLRTKAISNLSAHGRYITLKEVPAEDILDLCNRALGEYSRLIYKRKAQKRRTKHDKEDTNSRKL